jgi:ubiquinone/menaquinone biosynthesis C-methylase UbiE
MTQIAERITWAVEVLDVQPDDRLLEIGCGHGIAVDLIAQRLTKGHITAIDRSHAMIESARKRNISHFYHAQLQAISLEDADFDVMRFKKIFAINVSDFWTDPATVLPIIQNALASDGALYMFHQPPDAAKVQAVLDLLTTLLPAHGWTVVDSLIKATQPVQTSCVIAKPVSHQRS